MTRRAANTAALALSTTTTVAAPKALGDRWVKDVREAAIDLIGRLVAERSGL